MKKKLWIICLTFILCTSSGCVYYQEINKMAVILGIAVDQMQQLDGKKLYRVTIQVVDPNQIASSAGFTPGASGVPVLDIKGEGENIIQAVRDATRKTSRQTYFGHLEVIIIGEEIAREGLNGILDTFERDANVRAEVPVLISRGVPAFHVLGTLSALNIIPAQSINGKLKNMERLLGTGLDVPLYKLVQRISTKGINPCLTGVVVNGLFDKSSKLANVESSQVIQSFISGIGIFNREMKLVQWVDGADAKTITLLHNKLQNTVVSLPNSSTTFEITESNVDKEAVLRNGKYVLKVKIKLDAELEGLQEEIDVTKPFVVHKLEEQLNKKFRDDVVHGIQTVQRTQSDVFGFGLSIYQKRPQEWKKVEKDWDRIFQNASIEVSVQSNIQRLGYIQKHFPKEK